MQDRPVNRTQASAAVVDGLSTVLEIDPAGIAPEALLQDDLGADSLAVIEVVFTIEERHGVRLRDDVVRSVRTVADLITAATD